MSKGYLVEQDNDGRWFWGLVTSDSQFTSNAVNISAVTFACATDAECDFQEHVEAPIDISGRLVRSKVAIRNLVRAAAYAYPEWQNSYFGAVHWQPEDGTGCNWSISTYYGSDWSVCLQNIRPALQRLKDTYNIPVEH